MPGILIAFVMARNVTIKAKFNESNSKGDLVPLDEIEAFPCPKLRISKQGMQRQISFTFWLPYFPRLRVRVFVDFITA